MSPIRCFILTLFLFRAVSMLATHQGYSFPKLTGTESLVTSIDEMNKKWRWVDCDEINIKYTHREMNTPNITTISLTQIERVPINLNLVIRKGIADKHPELIPLRLFNKIISGPGTLSRSTKDIKNYYTIELNPSLTSFASQTSKEILFMKFVAFFKIIELCEPLGKKDLNRLLDAVIPAEFLGWREAPTGISQEYWESFVNLTKDLNTKEASRRIGTTSVLLEDPTEGTLVSEGASEEPKRTDALSPIEEGARNIVIRFPETVSTPALLKTTDVGTSTEITTLDASTNTEITTLDASTNTENSSWKFNAYISSIYLVNTGSDPIFFRIIFNLNPKTHSILGCDAYLSEQNFDYKLALLRKNSRSSPLFDEPFITYFKVIRNFQAKNESFYQLVFKGEVDSIASAVDALFHTIGYFEPIPPEIIEKIAGYMPSSPSASYNVQRPVQPLPPLPPAAFSYSSPPLPQLQLFEPTSPYLNHQVGFPRQPYLVRAPNGQYFIPH